MPDIDLVNVATGAARNSATSEAKSCVWSYGLRGVGLARRQCNDSTGWLPSIGALAEPRRIVPLSIDERPEVVVRHIKPIDRGIRSTTIGVAATEQRGRTHQHVVPWLRQGVPELLIIDREGRISWVGHPAGKSAGTDVVARIQEVLERRGEPQKNESCSTKLESQLSLREGTHLSRSERRLYGRQSQVAELFPCAERRPCPQSSWDARSGHVYRSANRLARIIRTHSSKGQFGHRSGVGGRWL